MAGKERNLISQSRENPRNSEIIENRSEGSVCNVSASFPCHPNRSFYPLLFLFFPFSSSVICWCRTAHAHVPWLMLSMPGMPRINGQSNWDICC